MTNTVNNDHEVTEYSAEYESGEVVIFQPNTSQTKFDFSNEHDSAEVSEFSAEHESAEVAEKIFR